MAPHSHGMRLAEPFGGDRLVTARVLAQLAHALTLRAPGLVLLLVTGAAETLDEGAVGRLAV